MASCAAPCSSIVRLGRFSPQYVSAAEPDERLVIDQQDFHGPLSVGVREKIRQWG